MSEAQVATIKESLQALQESLCATFSEVAHGQPFHEDEWSYAKGSGGGRTRVGGSPQQLWARSVCSFSAIRGTRLPEGALAEQVEPSAFGAMGVSVVLHSNNPWVPSVHCNVRFFHMEDGEWWFGGGIDMTPVYPLVHQVRDFHSTLAAVYQRYPELDYAQHKRTCDEYFYLPHRKETRGVGGVFYDRIGGPKREGLSLERCLEFTLEMGAALDAIVRQAASNQCRPFTEEMREHARYRRGRYVEFNLLYDRGTKFGLDSGGRAESILASMPDVANFRYNWSPQPHSMESYLYEEFLRARDWLGDETAGVHDPEEYQEYAPVDQPQLSSK